MRTTRGLERIFETSTLSQTVSGLVEPLMPTMRHPDMCTIPHNVDWDTRTKQMLVMDYLVHDYAAMCRKLKPTSRTVLFDVGASLAFHTAKEEPPIMHLLHQYEKFGFRFDHIYAYEATKQDPVEVYKKIPTRYQSAYHWINVGVSHETGGLNPLDMLINSYTKDDFVVFKLDIDTPAIELAMVVQLLEDPRFTDMIDAFYFEHHVHIEEMEKHWGKSMYLSVHSSLNIFEMLREKGIPAHYWV